MSVEYLESEKPVVVAVGQIEIELVEVGQTAAELVVVEAGSRGEVPFHRISRNSLVMSADVPPLRVVARSLTGSRFPDGRSVQVVVRVGHPPAQVELVLGSTDVGALSEPQLLDLRVEDGLLRVEALRLDAAAHAVEEVSSGEALVGLARECMYTTRALRQDSGSRLLVSGLLVGIDMSASMVPQQRSGALQVLLEVVLGIDKGLGDGGDVPVFAVGSDVVRVEPLSPRNVDDYVESVLVDRSPSSGCRPQLMADQVGPGRNQSKILFITDQVPGSFGSCLEQWHSVQRDWHLLLLGSEFELQAMTDIPTASGCAVSPELGRESLSGVSGEAARRDLIARIVGVGPETGVAR